MKKIILFMMIFVFIASTYALDKNLYGWNGSESVPLLTTPEGILRTDLNLIDINASTILINGSPVCTPDNALCNGTSTVTSGGGGNPFDQSLNTTDSPNFLNLTINDTIQGQVGNFTKNVYGGNGTFDNIFIRFNGIFGSEGGTQKITPSGSAWAVTGSMTFLDGIIIGDGSGDSEEISFATNNDEGVIVFDEVKKSFAIKVNDAVNNPFAEFFLPSFNFTDGYLCNTGGNVTGNCTINATVESIINDNALLQDGSKDLVGNMNIDANLLFQSGRSMFGPSGLGLTWTGSTLTSNASPTRIFELQLCNSDVICTWLYNSLATLSVSFDSANGVLTWTDESSNVVGFNLTDEKVLANIDAERVKNPAAPCPTGTHMQGFIGNLSTVNCTSFSQQTITFTVESKPNASKQVNVMLT